MVDNLSSRLESLRIDRSAPVNGASRGKRLPRIISLLGVAAACIAGVVAAPALKEALMPIEVTVGHVSMVMPSQAVTQFTATGYVQALRNSRLAPKVAGRVLRSHIEQGDTVEAGQLLLELDPADEVAQINLAKSQVATALAQLDSERAAIAVARAELREVELGARRARRLSDSGVAATGDAENLEARAESMRRSLYAAQNRAKAAKAHAEELEVRGEVLRTALGNLSIVSPFRGVVVNEPPRVGEYVGPQPPGVTVDMGGVRIADLSSLMVEADIPESRFRLLEKGSPAEIVLDAYPNKQFRGRVSTVTPEVDRAKATVRVKVGFADEALRVLPDLAARVSFLSKEVEPGARASGARKVIPKSAVTQRDGASVVFVVEDDRARVQNVRVGSAVGEGLELIEGPPSGAVVVTDVSPELKDGSELRVVGG
jgi:HlyD family secretion protein